MPKEATTESVFTGWQRAIEATLATLRGSIVISTITLEEVVARITGERDHNKFEITIAGGMTFEPPEYVEDSESWECQRDLDRPKEYDGVTVNLKATTYIREVLLVYVRDLVVPGGEKPGEFSFVGDFHESWRGNYLGVYRRIATHRIYVTPKGATYEIIEENVY